MDNEITYTKLVLKIIIIKLLIMRDPNIIRFKISNMGIRILIKY